MPDDVKGMFSDTLETVLINITPWWDLIILFGQIAGFAVIVFSVANMPQTMGRGMMNPQASKIKTIGGLIGGLFLINIKPFMDILSQTFFEEDSSKTLALAEISGGHSDFSIYVKFSLTILMFIGLFALIKGCLSLKNVSDDPTILGKAMGHIIGGILAINATRVIEVISYSVGDSLGSEIRGLFFG
ncbi:MAG: hypothetical protein LC660_18740 [Desulfobacteraceae bacterium]|nr:hypothetical protein [Desulfobacteraceae bacterium]